MMLGIEKEAVILFYAGLSGMVVFLGYQMLYLFRRLVKHHAAVTGIEDLCYWIAVSIYLFRQMYKTTYGSIRGFFILGVVGGCLFAWSGKKLLQKVVKKLRKNLEKRDKNR